MRVYHDWEFLERGPGYPIIPISVGMVREDGKSLYYVFGDAPWDLIHQHEWLRDNVVPYLGNGDSIPYADRDTILANVDAFLMRTAMVDTENKLQMWGWYSAYDHVCLAQLFGKMIDLPQYMPMWTNDLRQEAERLKTYIPKKDLILPKEVEHNALTDAKINWRMHNWLLKFENAGEESADEFVKALHRL